MVDKMKKVLYFSFLLLVLSFSDKVFAGNLTTKTYCFNGTQHVVSWDNGKTGLKSEDIVKNKESVINDKKANGLDIYSVRDTKSKCECYDSSDSCTVKEFTSCSSVANDYRDAFYTNITKEFDASKNKWKFYLKDVSNASDLKLYLLDKKTEEIIDIKNGNEYFEVDPDDTAYIVKAVLNGNIKTCGEYYVNSVEIQANSSTNINNPALTDEYYGCSRIWNIKNISEEVLKEVAHECYDEKIAVKDIDKLKENIDYYADYLENISKEKIDTSNESSIKNMAKTIGAGWTCTTDINQNINKVTSGEYIIGQNNTYWGAVCYETVTAQYDVPKYPKPGTGFSYELIYKVERVCKPYNKKQVEKKKECQYTVSCDSSYMETHFDGDPPCGERACNGPNDDFDSCILTCDGGKYSQSCINSCYKDVYGTNDETSNLIDQTVSSINDFVNKVAVTFETDNDVINYLSEKAGVTISPDSCITSSNLSSANGSGNTNGFNCVSVVGQAKNFSNCTSPHGLKFRFAPLCARTSGACCERLVDTNCAFGTETTYQNDLAKSISEYNNLVNLVDSIDSNSDVLKYEITDSFSNETFAFGSASANLGGALVATATRKGNISYVPSGNVVYGIEGQSINVSNLVVSSKTYVALPSAYLSKTNRKAVYVSHGIGYEMDASHKKFSNIGKIDLNYYISNPENNHLYFTHLNSKTINMSTVEDYNINFNATNLGATNLGFTVNCYYKINNDNNTPDNPNGNPGDNPNENSEGIKYIFRPIDLTNMFPLRDPRFNWQYVGTVPYYLNNKVNAPELIKQIESIGNNVYNNNYLDYEVKLTPTNIRKIKKYNKSISYGNYKDMTCANNRYNGFCKSTFLDSSEYVANSGSVRVNANIGTNND